MFMAGFFTRVKNCKQPKYPSADERIKKYGIYPYIKYYSAIKRNGVLTHAIPCMSLENTMLSEKASYE